MVDRSDPWSDASGANAGTLSVQVKRPEVLHVTREAVRLWGSFRDEYGIDVGFVQPGGVRVATTPKEVEWLRKSVRVQRTLGIEVEVLDDNELRVRFPWLGDGSGRHRAAVLDAFSSPLLAGPALIRACRQAGVLVVGHAEVEAIEPQNGRGFRVARPRARWPAGGW